MVITNRMIRMKEVQAKVGISRSMIYVLMGRGEFPASIKYSERVAVWPEDEIDAWILAKRQSVTRIDRTRMSPISAKYVRAYQEAA